MNKIFRTNSSVIGFDTSITGTGEEAEKLLAAFNREFEKTLSQRAKELGAFVLAETGSLARVAQLPYRVIRDVAGTKQQITVIVTGQGKSPVTDILGFNQVLSKIADDVRQAMQVISS